MPLPLACDEVHLWYVRCDDEQKVASLDRYASVLSPSEREHLARFAFEKDRLLFLMAHALLRVALSRYAKVAPETWIFEQSSLGKPHIAYPRQVFPLQFNLSHATGLAACAITRGQEVGIDVENTERRVDLGVARICFSAAEMAHLGGLARREQRDAFLQYWTLKEAYAKARGLGLSLPLAQISFHLTPGQPPRISFSPSFDDHAENWQFFQHRTSPQHCLAVAVRRPAVPRSNLVVRDVRSLLGTDSA
jgi:4'-phosphopantetheinyl transferase